MEYINANGLARLFIYLANIKSFPTPLKAAAIVSGIPEEDMEKAIGQSIYLVKDGQILYKNSEVLTA